MRLWHYSLIPYLPRKQLLGQHRECCAMRGLFWGKKHSVVDYVWKYNYLLLSNYHYLIIKEMIKRNYQPNKIWMSDLYRGKNIGYVTYNELPNFNMDFNSFIYPEHDKDYLLECINNLKRKGVKIEY